MADASHGLVRQAGLVAAEDTAFFTEQKPAELRRGSNGRQFSLAYQLGAIRAFNLFIFQFFISPFISSTEILRWFEVCQTSR